MLIHVHQSSTHKMLTSFLTPSCPCLMNGEIHLPPPAPVLTACPHASGSSLYLLLIPRFHVW